MAQQSTSNPFIAFASSVGQVTLDVLSEVGSVSRYMYQAAREGIRPPFRVREIFKQMEAIGVNSMPVVLITAIFTGMVLALQSYTGFKRFSAESLVGTVVALSMTRELGPVLTGLIVSGRAGASIAAELGTMKVTEQIDALVTMGISPVNYLMVPRIIAGIVMLPVLVVFSDVIGITGGYLVGVHVLDANPTVYIKRTFDYLEVADVMGGLMKAAVFGGLMALISSYKGFMTEGGAEGVGKATTGAVVLSSMAVLISNYFLTSMISR
ncbi:MAG: ABC transporter permease [Nitrospirota bacterium]|nr:ABC transporter permease [Nitrospirota bacterium]